MTARKKRDDEKEIREGESIIEPLPEDHETPFSPPTDPIEDASEEIEVRTQEGRLNPMHQDTDSWDDIDKHEWYDEGLSGAAESEEPNAGDAVVDYNPEADSRRQKGQKDQQDKTSEAKRAKGRHKKEG